MSIFDVIALFGGLAMFLYGMRLMSSSLKEGSTGAVKRIMSKLTDNIFKSFLLGIALTALIQSSTATIVITSGLVAASIINFKSSLGIIIGANIGTTVTGQIIRLMDLNGSSSSLLQFFKPATLAPVALIIGIILIMFVKFNKSETIGSMCVGFGILFSGLMNMTNAVSQLNSAGVFDSLFVHLGDSPILGYGIGALVAFILQSSSATIGILQAFSVSGQLFFKSIYTVLLGIYLGDCTTTAIVCSIGAKQDAKRVGVVNILYNLSETVIVLMLVTIAKALGLLDGIWNMTVNSGVIADTNTIFNSLCAVIVFPCIGVLEKLSYKIIREEKTKEGKYNDIILALDDKFIVTPSIALNSAYDCLCKCYDIAYDNIQRAFKLLIKYDPKLANDLNEDEEELDNLTDKVNSYLVSISRSVTDKQLSAIVNQYYNVATEFERLGDHASNICEHATSLYDNGVSFSDNAQKELEVIHELLDKVLDYARLAFMKRDVNAAYHIEPLEEVVDDMVASMKDKHVERLQVGECSVVTGTVFLNLLNDLERISDVCSNVGIATVSRVNPELASLAHDYVSSLHVQENTQFHEEYNKAHDYYFTKINSIAKKH